MRRVALLVGVAVCTILPAQAGAAVQIGDTFPVDSSDGTCIDGTTMIQADSIDDEYAAPTSGVITSWSHLTAAATGFAPNPVDSLKLKVLRPLGGTTFRVVGDSGFKTTTPSTLVTFGARIPVRAGDVLGMSIPEDEDGYCLEGTAPGYTFFEVSGDLPVGAQVTASGPSSYQLDLSARLEPDGDRDGYGDESQDDCTTEPGPAQGCDPPETTITKAPKSKTKKRKAKFEFASDEGGSTFECSLDAGPFEACAPPFKDKVKRRKHTFAVRAIDPAGSTDPSPATDEWKVKKKR